jgi:hypothetical protein
LHTGFVDIDAHELGDIRTSAAGDARPLARLLLRSCSLVDDATLRAQLLDVIDRLLEINAYGIADAIDEIRRWEPWRRPSRKIVIGPIPTRRSCLALQGVVPAFTARSSS